MSASVAGRLIIAGHFSGPLNRLKRAFFLERRPDSTVVGPTVLLNATRPLLGSAAGVEEHAFPAYLSSAGLDPQSLFSTHGRARCLALEGVDEEMLSVVEAHEANIVAAGNRHGSSPVGLAWRAVKRIRRAAGWSTVAAVLSSLALTPSDVVIIFSEHFSGARLLRAHAEAVGARVLMAEYGELPGTVFVSDTGMFHESLPRAEPGAFGAVDVSADEEESVAAYFDELLRRRYSTKMYSWEASEDPTLAAVQRSDRPVVYLNGIQEQASGLVPRRSPYSHEFSPHFASNVEALDHLLDLAESAGWTVVYKEHPNTVDYYPGAVVRRTHPNLVTLGNVDIHSVLARADAVVTLGSKTIFSALAHGTPICLLGPYTIAPSDLERGVGSFVAGEASSVDRLFQVPRGSRVDQPGLRRFAARMLSSVLYRLDPELDVPTSRDRATFWRELDLWASGERPHMGPLGAR